MYKLSLFADWKVGDTGYPTSKNCRVIIHCCIAELLLGAPCLPADWKVGDNLYFTYMPHGNHREKFKRFYRRSLPHIFPEDATIFFSYILDRALPKRIIDRLKAQHEIEIVKIKDESKDEKTICERLQSLKSAYFGKYDHLLDNEKSGARYLDNDQIAEIVQDYIMHLAKDKYELICYCIMPNHVHKIVKEKDLFIGHLMQSHKGYTGKAANKILKRSGRFWQRESFDMVIRNEKHLIQKVIYIMNNPVAAGLVKDFRAWKHCYINPAYNWILEA